MLPMSDVAEKASLLRLSPPIAVLRSVLGSDHLHFGLWPADRPGLTLEEAQQELVQRLFALLPPPPARILLVACDPGLTAFLLAGKGYAVTAIAVCGESAAAVFGRHPHPSVSSAACGLFDEDPTTLAPGSYDAAMLVESAADLAPLGRLFQRVRELLKDGGTAVLAGEVAGGRGARTGSTLPTADDYTVALAEHGFRPVAGEVVSARVSPTCEAMVSRLAAACERAADGGAPADTRAALREALERWTRRRDSYAAGGLGYELRAVKKDPYLIRPYRDGDEQEILQMFREVFGVERTLAHWSWKFTENPWRTRLVAEAVTGTGELVAHFAGYPVPFYRAAAGGSEFFSHQVGDTMTRASVRQAGLGKTGILARISSYYFARSCGDIPFVYGFNTGHIRKLGERYLGYTYIDSVGHWVRDLTAGPLPAMRAVRRALSGYSVGEITAATTELDTLFARVRDDYGLLVRRDAEYVGWRYLRCPDRVHRVFGIRRWGRLVGWGTFARRGSDLVWGDALVDRRHVAAVPWLLRRLAAGPYRGVDRIWGWFSPWPQWWGAVLAVSGFARVGEPNDLTPCFVFFNGPEPGIRQELAERWYYTYGDSDLF
jgi:hypothetical protein